MKIGVAALSVAALALAACGDSADDTGNQAAGSSDFPTESIDLVIPYSAGGTTDLSARALAKALEAELGTPVVPVNKEGAAGVTGAAEVAGAKPDGYTLVYAPQGVYMQAIMGQAPYAFDDFEPIRGAITTPGIIIVPGSSPVNDMNGFRDAAPIEYGVPGFGNLDHLDLALIFERMGVEATAVPFDGGGTVLQAVLGGQVDTHMSVSIGQVLEQIEAGRLKAVGVVTPEGERMPELPDVPTIGEQDLGVENDEMFLAVWGVAAPAGIGDEEKQVLEQAIAKAVQNEEYQAFIEANHFQVVNDETAANWYDRAEEDAQRAKGILERLGIR